MTTITFVGAGSVEFTRDLIADILGFPELAGVTLRLHDVDADRLATAEAVARSVARQRGAGPAIEAHPQRRSALDGADFVVNMVQIGGLAATRTDFEVPARFGVRQTIADTFGIGGIFRALRTFPFLEALAADMRELCPGAPLLNYTNPMAMNIGYLARIAPELPAFGLCHSVYWTVVGLSEVMGVPHEEVSWRSAGINHQAWILSMERDGQDLYPLLDERIAADPELRRRVRVDMYRRLGYYPTETSEHSSEYVPWYLRSETEATEYAPQVIHSIVTGTPRRIQVNTANTGLIENLPVGAPVEVTATIDELGVHPWHMGALPPQCAALNRNLLGVADLVAHAAVQRDPRAIRQAAMLDPSTAATLTVDEIWALCDALVEAHGELLPEWARGSLAPRP